MPAARKGRVSGDRAYHATANHLQGKAQTAVMGFANESRLNAEWIPFILKPGGVLPAKSGSRFYHRLLNLILGSHLSTWNDELAAVMVDLALHGGSQPVLDGQDITQKARKLAVH
jgi:hypothetical protein